MFMKIFLIYVHDLMFQINYFDKSKTKDKKMF